MRTILFSCSALALALGVSAASAMCEAWEWVRRTTVRPRRDDVRPALNLHPGRRSLRHEAVSAATAS